jgi:hypothetical protein
LGKKKAVFNGALLAATEEDPIANEIDLILTKQDNFLSSGIPSHWRRQILAFPRQNFLPEIDNLWKSRSKVFSPASRMLLAYYKTLRNKREHFEECPESWEKLNPGRQKMKEGVSSNLILAGGVKVPWELRTASNPTLPRC